MKTAEELKKLNLIMDKIYSSREHHNKEIAHLTDVIDIYEKAKTLSKSENEELIELGRKILLNLEEILSETVLNRKNL